MSCLRPPVRDAAINHGRGSFRVRRFVDNPHHWVSLVDVEGLRDIGRTVWRWIRRIWPKH